MVDIDLEHLVKDERTHKSHYVFSHGDPIFHNIYMNRMQNQISILFALQKAIS